MDSLDVFFCSLKGGSGEVCLGFCEGGDEPRVRAKEIRDHCDFAIAGAFPAADSYGWDWDCLGDFFRGGRSD